ncbi:MAG: hypothetical protein RMK57_07445 [Bryobacterales bacterium]|nr:hypothetical protein [Bryobacterales bacterium]
MVEGVRQDSLEELERTLTALAREYGEAVRQGGRERAQRVRQLVLTSKAHTRLAAQNPRLTPAKRAEKKEALLWLTTWLENPELFPVWVDLRKEKLPPRELT